MEGECVMWGTRVIVLKQLQSAILNEPHVGHPGIVRMKELSRSHVWWLYLDQELEKRARECESCQEGRKTPTAAPLHPWSCMAYHAMGQSPPSLCRPFSWQDVFGDCGRPLKMARGFGDASYYCGEDDLDTKKCVCYTRAA